MSDNEITVGLVRPAYKERYKELTYPLGLGYIGSSLKKKGYHVLIFDLNIYSISNSEFVKFLEEFKIDVIGITALTVYFEAMVNLSKLIKKNHKLQKIPLVIGGVHVSSLPQYSLEMTGADFAIIGEAEDSFINLLESIFGNKKLEDVNGLGYFKEDKYIQTDLNELIKDLDDLPYPAWDLIKPELYPKIPHGVFYKKFPVFPIFTSRGCPFGCKFCASRNFWRGKIRYRSVENVVDEIEYLVNNYGAKEIHIWDDNFTLNRKRVIDFCQEIKRRKLKLFFACPNGVKIDTLDEKLLKIMYKTGFYSLIFAIETGSEKMQKIIGKNLKLDEIANIIDISKKIGFTNRAFFIIGLPLENIRDINDTITFSLRLKLDTANFFVFTPLPGSDFFEKWIVTKNLKNICWNFDFFNNPQDMSKLNNISMKSIKKLQTLCYIKFYLLRPWKLIFFLLNFKIQQIPIILDRIKFVLYEKIIKIK